MSVSSSHCICKYLSLCLQVLLTEFINLSHSVCEYIFYYLSFSLLALKVSFAPLHQPLSKVTCLGLWLFVCFCLCLSLSLWLSLTVCLCRWLSVSKALSLYFFNVRTERVTGSSSAVSINENLYVEAYPLPGYPDMQTHWTTHCNS